MEAVKKPLQITVCGNYGATNIGDEAILDGILALLRRVKPDAKIAVLSANPAETASMHNVASMPVLPCGLRSFAMGLFNGGIVKTLGLISKSDAFILGGGGLFTDEKMRAVLIWAIQARVAAFLGKAIFCLGQSVGPLRTFFGRRMTKKVFSRARAITVRDLSSQRVLHGLGLPYAQVLADPAFGIHLEQRPAEIREKYVVFTIRPWIKGDSLNLYKFCAQFIDWLWAEHGLKSVLVPFQQLQDSDAEVLNNIFAQVQNKEAAHLYEFTADYTKVIELIGKAKAVIGMRLHSLIFSTMTQTPFIALSYSDKVSSFVSDLTLADYIMPWEELTTEELKRRFNLLLKNYDHVRNTLMEQNILMRKKAHDHEEILRSFFASIK
jgi:polysaccharide pyruvyl transferase CsaB